MKTKNTTSATTPRLVTASLAALLLCAGCASTSQNNTPTTGTVTTTHQVTTRTGAATVIVTFNNPEKFTDLKTTLMASDKDRANLLDDIRDFVLEQAPRHLAAGQTFSVTFNDIDMAGEFQPERSASLQDVRIVKEIFPPRIALDFSLKNPDGAIAAAGARNLTDLSFMNTISVAAFQNDPLRHEKTLLHNWLAREFAPPRRANN